MAQRGISKAKQREIECAIKAGETQSSIAARLRIGTSTVARHSMRLIAAGALPSKRQKLLEQGALELSNAMRLVTGWSLAGSKTFARYGKQKMYYRGGRRCRIGLMA